jgi:hypothetical protein
MISGYLFLNELEALLEKALSYYQEEEKKIITEST